jgi:hypothetical protein
MRDATGRPGLTGGEFLAQVQVTITGEAAMVWVATREGSGWRLDRGTTMRPVVLVEADGDTMWRLCTKNITPRAARARLRVQGDLRLADQLLEMVSIIGDCRRCRHRFLAQAELAGGPLGDGLVEAVGGIGSSKEGGVAERVWVRDITGEEDNRLLRIVRPSSGSVVTWRRAQMVLLSAQGMDVLSAAKVTFTSHDRVRDVLHNVNLDGFDSLYPRYAGGRPPTFTLAQRRQIKQVALSRPQGP